nr:MAG: ADP-ribosyltransferase [Bacteriophage sp.]
MSIICPNLKNEEVAREFEELKNATSEAAAYHIWSLNNGNGIDKAPNGEPSKLFSDLLEHYNGDRVAAIQAKARTYSESFKDWFGDWVNPLKPGDIVFGHPAIGKTYSLESGKYKDKIIDWDVEFNEKRDKWIEDHSNTVKGTPEYKKARNEYLIYPENHPDYVEFLTEEWERVKSKTKKEGKILFASPHNLLKMFPQDFDRIINLKDEDFVKRNIEIGGKERESKLWKEGINNTILNITNIPIEYLNENQHFEDYLNKYIGVSKVVDENGEPLVVYHGTDASFDTFQIDYESYNGFKDGAYFTSNKKFAKGYTVKNNIMPVFLSIKDPLEFDGNGVAWNEISFKEVSKILNIDEDTLRSVVRPKYQPTLLQSIKEIFGKNKDSKYAFYNANALIKLARLLNKDGAYLQHLTDSGKTFLGTFKRFNADQIVVLDPNQIKSIDNQGTLVISNSKDLLDNSRSKMATVLRDVANKINMQPVSIEYTDRPLNEIYPEATYWTPAIYDRNTNKIVVNTTGDFSRYGSLENVLLHEIAHAITLDSLAADTEAANELRAIQKEYAATHEDHASKNVYEFAAELFSNPEVIHNMQDFPAPTGKKTILQRLMDWFKRLFGKNTTHENLINRIVENVIEYNAYQTLEHNENTDDYIPLALPAASKREEIAATKLMSTFDSIVKTLEIRTQSMQYNPIDDSFDRRETVRNTSVFNRLNNLSNTVKNITDPNSMLDVLNGSIEYMNSVIDSLAEAEKVLDNINEKIENAKTMGDEATTNKYRVALDNFGAEYLYPHEANLNNLYETVFSQEFNDAIYESLLGTNVFNDIRQTLNALRAEFSSIKMDSRNNIGWKYKNTVIRTLTNFLKGEMEEANDPRIESALMNWLSFDSDISAYHKCAGLPNSTNNVVISSVRKVIGDVNNEVHKKVYHKYAELMGLAAATRDHLLLFERNSKGKKTGYIIRDRKYGEYQNDKYNWRKKWLKDHKLASVDELKLDQNLWLEYQRAYNDWKSKHAERKYTPEFYDIFANLSIEANQALSEVNIDIDNLLKPYLDNVTKKPRFENMSQDDYDKYQRLLEKKRNLANPYDALTGEIKPEDSVEYKIAMELTEAYEKLRKGLKSKANMAAFMAEMEKMREIEGYTPDGRYTLYEAWLERNTRWEYTPEFEALVSKQNKKDYGEIYDRLYQARTNLLKLYRTDRYEVDYVRMPQEVKEKIRELDIAMYRIRRKSGKLGGGRRLFKSELSDIAKDNGGKDAVSPDDIWVDDKGVKHYFSYMTTVKPINDKYMHRVPNNNWAETSEESAFYNPNYDPTIPEAEHPKLELYDNRKDYNAVMRNTNLSKLRQALIDTIGETNAKLTHTNYRNDYKLPQIPGTIWNYISGKGLVTGVRDYMLDAFAITPDDELHGVKNKVRPNGTEINIMPTQYTTMLADPSVGTNDLVGAVMRYYRMGCNYEAKKKVAPQLNLLDETIKREGKVVKSQNTVSAANSNLSNVIHKYISYHLYGRRTALPEITIGNSRISLDKIFRHFATWGRDIGLSWNLRSAISGGVSAWSFYAADAYINRHMNVRDFTLGNAELAKELLTLKTLRQLGKNMGDSDLVSMLEYNGLSFNQEEDMANTNRWRVGRMITRTIEPYSAFKLMSFLPNSVFMRGIYNNYRLLELEDGNKHFISENDFLYNHFPEQSIEEKRAIYNSTKTTLWSAYDKKGGVKIKPEYKKYVTKELENEISDKLGNISSHAEGMVETADKSGVHLHTALSTILMFRAFLPKNIENTWNPAYWNYQTKELAIGTAMAYWYGWLYGANNWGIKAIRALTFRNKERDISELSDKFNVSESYTRKQIETYAKRFNAQVFTYIFWLTLFNALGMIGSTGPDDDYWYQNILMLELKKISLESGSRYNVMDIADIFNSVSPLLQTVEDIGTAFGPWSYFKERKYKKIKKGAFKGLYGWQRDFIKVIPWLNAYYNMKNPGEKLRDLQNRIGG